MCGTSADEKTQRYQYHLFHYKEINRSYQSFRPNLAIYLFIITLPGYSYTYFHAQKFHNRKFLIK
jgi:hypothetical protein